MRKIFFALLLCVVIILGCFVFFLSRVYHAAENNMQITVNETDDTYRFNASYDRHRAKQVQYYMDKQLNTKVFRNASVIDADMSLDENAVNIHVKSHPGYLEIRLDKHRNDSAAYLRVKELGEEIKLRLTRD